MDNILENKHITAFFDASRENLEPWLQQFKKICKTTQRSNPVLLFGFDIYEDLMQEGGGLKNLEKTLAALSNQSFLHRAKQLKQFVAKDGFAENQTKIHALITEIAEQHQDDFKGFCTSLEKIYYGLVLTGHPTFAQTQETQALLSQIVAGEDATGQPLKLGEVKAALEKLSGKTHIPAPDIDLQTEYEWAERIAGTCRQALYEIYEIAFQVAQKYFPDQWRHLMPALINIASWVGYDTDGRNDIGWRTPFQNRLQSSIAQIDYYIESLTHIIKSLKPQDAQTAILQEILTILQKEHRARLAELDILQTGELKLFSQKIISRTDRLKNAKNLAARLQQAAGKITDGEIAKKLLILSAEMNNYGLVTAHCHLRLNSVQLHNALWQILGLQGEAEEYTTWRRYIRKLDSLFDSIKPVTINFGVVDVETMNARRLMMTASLMLNYIDDEVPIRFLIAECENPFTILCVLYLAKLFGIEEKLTISPLFETPIGLEKGSDIIKHLLHNQHYRAWLDKVGVLPIEVGYSDAGRFSGQITAALAIERMHIQLLNLMAQHDVKASLIMFNTHGESLGRGGYGKDFSGRLDYLLSARAREIAQKNAVHIIHETSFQGSDGYALLGTRNMAGAIIGQALAHNIQAAAKNTDPFYTETDSALTFFHRIKRFNENLFKMSEYANLLKMGHDTLIYKTGSRKRKRQHEVSYGVNSNHPSQIRAIPHNTMLQQMGWFANSLGGLGIAIIENKEWYWEMLKSSARMRQLMTVVWLARLYSSHDAFYAYSDLYNPDLWLRQAHIFGGQVEGNHRMQDRVTEFCRIADFFSKDDNYAQLAKGVRILGNDSIDLGISLMRSEKIWSEISMPLRSHSVHSYLILIHSIRLALQMMCYTLAVRIPRFSPFADVTHERVVRYIFDFEIPEALEMLEKIFPKKQQGTDFSDYGNQPSYLKNELGMKEGYQHLYDDIFTPLAKIHDLLRQTGGIISNFVSAHG